MPGTKEIKQRIKSVKNTKKITKAMELVAASKMKRAVTRAVSSRLYSGYSWELLQSLSQKIEQITHPFFVEQETGKTLFVLITSNSGLCGGYNSQVIKKALAMIKGIDANMIDIVAIGKKGDAALRSVGSHITASFFELPDNATISDIAPLSKFLIDEYKSEKYKKIYVAYTDFISALNQKASIRQLLPISKADILPPPRLSGTPPQAGGDELLGNKSEYIFEGDMNTLIESLAEKVTRMQVYQMLLESSASEQSSRMLAMKNASDAAGEMIRDLTLVFNKARQAGITQEISEISAGMASLS